MTIIVLITDASIMKLAIIISMKVVMYFVKILLNIGSSVMSLWG